MSSEKLDTKEELIQRIKEWLKIDNDIIRLNKDLKDLKKKQKQLTNTLVNVMKTNQLDCFDINGGKILYKKSISKKPINSKMLLNTLKTYFSTNPSTADEVTEYILNSRESVVKETIKRKIDK
jgi:seryl-tRNA synthetase